MLIGIPSSGESRSRCESVFTGELWRNKRVKRASSSHDVAACSGNAVEEVG